MTAFILLGLWFGGLCGAAVHDLATRPQQIKQYRIGIDYSGNRLSLNSTDNNR